jgi:riboflavin biosynthesis pyrimidine reductase
MGRVLVEGGGTLARAFLEQGLADEAHLFWSEQPAGGVALSLSMPSSWSQTQCIHWPGGTWCVWR